MIICKGEYLEIRFAKDDKIYIFDYTNEEPEYHTKIRKLKTKKDLSSKTDLSVQDTGYSVREVAETVEETAPVLQKLLAAVTPSDKPLMAALILRANKDLEVHNWTVDEIIVCCNYRTGSPAGDSTLYYRSRKHLVNRGFLKLRRDENGLYVYTLSVTNLPVDLFDQSAPQTEKSKKKKKKSRVGKHLREPTSWSAAILSNRQLLMSQAEQKLIVALDVYSQPDNVVRTLSQSKMGALIKRSQTTVSSYLRSFEKYKLIVRCVDEKDHNKQHPQYFYKLLAQQ